MASCSIQPTAATGGSVSRYRGTQRELKSVVAAGDGIDDHPSLRRGGAIQHIEPIDVTDGKDISPVRSQLRIDFNKRCRGDAKFCQAEILCIRSATRRHQ